MRALLPTEGWRPLALWAPARSPASLQGFLDKGVDAPAAATPEEWSELAAAAKDALRRGHAAQAGGDQHLGEVGGTVHGDARLDNIMARRSPSGGHFEALFVDFGWAGRAGSARSVSRMASPLRQRG